MKTFEAKKLYYSIGEVSKITGLPSYLLRYWENEFEQLKPSRNPKGNRVYTNKDISTILSIKNLIQDQGYTTERARAMIQGQSGVQAETSQTAEMLKAHHQTIKDQARHQGNEERRKQVLLDAKALLEEMLVVFK
ncbi:MAG: MerR family transcriptional regulator [Chlorobiales bacterium]|nr:MerR family transcriptional regulator [Chlorobiales bacterium]